MTNPYKNRDLRTFLKSIPRETVERENKKQLERNQKMHAEFLVDLNRGICFLCKREMDTFFPKRFCLHWFTYPTGIRKKHFSAHLNGELSYSRLDAYFRWLANSEAPIVNINDLAEEVSSTSYIETTIRYKNIECIKMVRSAMVRTITYK